VPHTYAETGQLKRDGYAFRTPEHKADALLGVVVI